MEVVVVLLFAVEVEPGEKPAAADDAVEAKFKHKTPQKKNTSPFESSRAWCLRFRRETDRRADRQIGMLHWLLHTCVEVFKSLLGNNTYRDLVCRRSNR